MITQTYSDIDQLFALYSTLAVCGKLWDFEWSFEWSFEWEGSAEPDHLGRLAGYTNRKPKYLQNSQFPFVRLHKWQYRKSPYRLEGVNSATPSRPSAHAPHPKMLEHDRSRADFNEACKLIRQGKNR